MGESLDRLKRAYADVVYLHFPDPGTSIDGALEALNCLYEKGKLKEFGLSNYPAWMVADIYHVCNQRGWIKPTVYEGIYNPLARKVEIELMDCLRYFNIRFHAYNPLAGGLLSGRYKKMEEVPLSGRFVNRPNYQSRYWKKSCFQALDLLRKVSYSSGISIPELTYRWLVHHSILRADMSDAVIIGASSLKHLRQNLDAAQKPALPTNIASVFDEVWEISKSDSPEYFTLYKNSNK